EMLAQSARDGGEALRWLARSSVPSGLRSILARCLAPDPADRYRRAAELAEDLDRWRTDRSLSFADEPPWYGRVNRWIRRRRGAWGAGLRARAVAPPAMLGVWTSFQNPPRRQAEDKLALNGDRQESGAFRYQRLGHWRADSIGDPAEVAEDLLKPYNVI